MKLSKVKVQEAMAEKGLSTFTELAEKLNITKNQLSVMLSDNYDPFKSRVVDLGKMLGVSPEALLETSDLSSSLEIKTSNDDITAIELFAGAGGLALGLEEAGIKTLEHVEIDEACCRTLRHNRPNWNIICEDIHDVDFSSFKGKVDLVTGGFPCQAFSYAGKQLGFNDTRGTLFHEFARCLKEVNPKMFLAENVRGLESHDKGRTLQTIINVFESFGYNVQYKALNACYYGVGQKRQRIIIIGIRNDLDVHFHYPEPDDHMTTLREALKDVPDSPGVKYSQKKEKVLAMVPPGGCWVDLPDDVARDYMGKSYYSGGGRRGMARRISWDEPCLTLTCSPVQKQTERCHPDETRPFTVREYARIQSFPDDWQFCGSLSDQYKQIGNAVPVEMARRVAVEVKKALDDCKG